MGKLVTKGFVEKEYEAEIMELRVSFQKTGSSSQYILAGVQNLCESFLKELLYIGIEPEKVRMIDEGISEDYNSENLRAKRSIVIETDINIELCTCLFSIIKKYESVIIYKMSYKLKDDAEKDKELLQEAVDDSRKQAEIIALSLGKTVVGVLSVNDEKYLRRNMAKSITVDDVTPVIPTMFISDTPLSDRTALPTIKKSEDIEIAWEMSE